MRMLYTLQPVISSIQIQSCPQIENKTLSIYSTLKPAISWINNVDVSTESAGPTIVKGIGQGTKLDTIILTAGYFGKESFEELDWDKQLTMYKISAISTPFIVSYLVKADMLSKGSKIILLTSESGSITLRHESEGGGMYGHHASKAAENMVGKLLSLDLKDKGIAVGMVHPGFMRTEMTKSVGFDKFWDDAGGESIVLFFRLVAC